jgi:hypothetical protein
MLTFHPVLPHLGMDFGGLQEACQSACVGPATLA